MSFITSKVADIPQTNRPERLRYSRSLVVSVYAALICVCALLAYFWEFQGFSGWDDEGYLMMTIKNLLQGHTLYNQIYTQYGPFYYEFKWLIFRATGAAVTNDSVRFIAVGIWVMYPCFCSWAILRVTKSLSMSVLCFVMAAIATSRVLRWGPGHPNDLSGLLFSALIFAASFLHKKPRGALRIAGIICTAALLVKLNTGVYLGLGLIAGLFPFTKPFPMRRAAYAVFAVAALAFPTLLMHAHLSEGWAMSLDIVITLGLASAFLSTTRAQVQPSVELRTWATALTASVLFGFVVFGILIATGSSMGAIVYQSVLQHLGTDKSWYIAVREAFTFHCALVTLFGFGLMLWTRRDPDQRSRSNQITYLKLVIWLLLFALIVLNTDRIPLATGQVICVDAPALLWLALLPPGKSGEAGTRPFRYVLVFATLFMLLFAYPVGGDHADMPTIGMIVAYVVCLHDALVIIREKYRDGLSRVGWAQATRPAFICFSFLILLGLAVYNYRHYRSWAPLDLPGARRVHLEAQEVKVFQTLVRKINEDCNGFITMPGLTSLYFWTGQEPPTTINMSNWVTVLPVKYQYQIINAIDGNKRDCVIENDYWVEWWRRGQDLNKIPLVSYIRKDFRPYDQVGDYRILIRGNRPDK